MKIRIKGNSVRYRLTKTDISNLAKNGCLQEETNFIGKTLFYALKCSLDGNFSADFIENTVTVFMPETMVAELVETDKVGFGDASGTIQLLVEKDFTCLETVEEDQSDNYPNPLVNKLTF